MELMLLLPVAMIGLSIWQGWGEWRKAIVAGRSKRAEKRQLVEDHEIALEFDALVERLIELGHKVNYRYNIHCPCCGRFSRQELGMTDCSKCGLYARSEPWTGSIPIQLVGIDAPVLQLA
jgi:hypothetical protein